MGAAGAAAVAPLPAALGQVAATATAAPALQPKALLQALRCCCCSASAASSAAACSWLALPPPSPSPRPLPPRSHCSHHPGAQRHASAPVQARANVPQHIHAPALIHQPTGIGCGGDEGSSEVLQAQVEARVLLLQAGAHAAQAPQGAPGLAISCQGCQGAAVAKQGPQEGVRVGVL